MKFSELTGIGRLLDPKYPTNIAIVLLSLLIAVLFGAWTLISGSSLITAAAEAFRSSMIVFLGWALAREFDPDHPYSAFLAAFAILAVYLTGLQANLLFLAFLLLMLRYINRTSGVAATTVDLGVGFVLTVWLSWSFDWIIGILGAVAYALDGFLADKHYTRLVFATLSLLAAITALLFAQSGFGFSGFEVKTVLLSALLIAVGLPLYLSYEKSTSLGDFTNTQLDPRRIQWAEVFYLGSTILIGLKLGLQGTGEALAVGAVSTAAGIYYLLSLLFSRAD